jgi:site-specific recombinase XerD
LRRDPHILGFLRGLHQQRPALKNGTRLKHLIILRRLFDDLARSRGSLRQGLLVDDDLPPMDIYLPKPLSPEDDQLLDRQLLTQDDMPANALRLLRATGMRVGECCHLAADCLHPLGRDQWVLKVPLGKLHTERWIPVDENTRQLIARLLALRPTAHRPDYLLLPPHGYRQAYESIRKTLAQAARLAGCSSHITPHRLRHSFATEMIGAGVSLPATMLLLGHKSIRMTMRYVHVSNNDLQQQYHQARRTIASKHPIPKLPMSQAIETAGHSAILALRNSLAAVQHLLANYRLGITNQTARHRLARLANRLVKISTELTQF